MAAAGMTGTLRSDRMGRAHSWDEGIVSRSGLWWQLRGYSQTWPGIVCMPNGKICKLLHLEV